MEPSQKADVFMRIFNADGSEVSACGNATRCIALIAAEETGPLRRQRRDEGRPAEGERRRRRPHHHRHGQAALCLGRDPARRAVRQTRPASSCRSDPSMRRCCTRHRSSTSAIRTPSSGSTTSMPTIWPLRAAAREPSDLSRAGQYLAGPGHVPQRPAAAHLGAGRRANQGLRHGRLCRRRCCGAQRASPTARSPSSCPAGCFSSIGPRMTAY